MDFNPNKVAEHIGVTSPGKEVTMSLLEHRPDLLTVQEAAEILRADPATVEDFIRSGEIVSAKIAGKSLIPRAFLEDFIEKSCKACYNKGVEISTPPLIVKGNSTLTTAKVRIVRHFKERLRWQKLLVPSP